jgi:cold shock CspA family protein
MDSAFKRFFSGSNDATSNEAGDNSEPRPEEKRVIGKIIKVSDKGWGFISSKDIKWTRIFFHWTSLRQDTLNFKDIHNGQRVEFTPIEVEGKGTRAIKIRVITEEVTEEATA